MAHMADWIESIIPPLLPPTSKYVQFHIQTNNQEG